MDNGLLSFLDASRSAAREGASEENREVRARADTWLSPLLRRAAAVSGHSGNLSHLERGLLREGATNASDFLGLSVVEAAEIWSALQGWPSRFVDRFLLVCSHSNVDATESVPPRAQANVQKQKIWANSGKRWQHWRYAPQRVDLHSCPRQRFWPTQSAQWLLLTR